MNNYRDKITPIQLAIIVISTMFGVYILALPKFVVEGAGAGAPFASLVGVTVAFIGLLVVVFLGKRFPKETIIGYNNIILGRTFGTLFSFLIVLYFIAFMGLETRQYAEVVAGALLPDSPIQVSILFMIFLCATTGFQNVATFSYIHFFYMPLIVIPLIVIIIPSFKDIEVYHITPILGDKPTFGDFISGGLVVTKAIMNVFMISMVIPFMKDPKACVKGGVIGFWIGALMVVILITMTLAVFGSEEIKQMFWPTLILGRMVQVPAEILSRIDALLLISWIVGVYTSLLSYYFVFVRGIAELINYHRYGVISLIGSPIAFVIAMIPGNIYEVYHIVLLLTQYGILLMIVYPLCLLLIAMIRKKGETAS